MGGARIYKTGSPYNGVELADIDFEQTADTMYLAHIDHAPAKLVRTGHTSWSFKTLTFGADIDPPASITATPTTPNTAPDEHGASTVNYAPRPANYVVSAVSDVSGDESRTNATPASATNDLTLKGNINTITWPAVAGATRYNVYKADDTQFYGYIGTTKDLTFVDNNIGPALDHAPLDAYNPFAQAGDYPSTVTLFEQRSMWARTRNVPNGVWGSRSGFLENMDRSRPLRPNDSLSLSIVAGRVNSVNQLVSTTSLIALSSDAIFKIDGDGNGGVLTANSAPAARRQIGRGGSRLGPLVVDNVIFYSPAVGSSVRTIGYDFSIDGLKSNDVSIYSPHFFEGHAITSWCYAQEPRSLIWAARADGKLLCFTWEQEQNVWGWTVCETDGKVLSVCSISEMGEDRVYLIVERIVQGVARRFVERMASHLWDDVAETCFMDCAVSASLETAKSTFTGLWHLEGRTDVCGIVDGFSVTGLSVTNGTLVLPKHLPSGKVVSFGIPYQVDVETLPYRADTQSGSTIGRRQQAGDVVLMVRETRAISAGINEASLFKVKSRTTEAYAQPDELMDGEWTVSTANKIGTTVQVLVRQTEPLPFTLLAIVVEPVING